MPDIQPADCITAEDLKNEKVTNSLLGKQVIISTRPTQAVKKRGLGVPDGRERQLTGVFVRFGFIGLANRSIATRDRYLTLQTGDCYQQVPHATITQLNVTPQPSPAL